MMPGESRSEFERQGVAFLRNQDYSGAQTLEAQGWQKLCNLPPTGTFSTAGAKMTIIYSTNIVHMLYLVKIVGGVLTIAALVSNFFCTT